LESSSGNDVNLPLFSSTAAGLTPASGGGTSNFLRADGTWVTPPGGGGSGNQQYAIGYWTTPVVGTVVAGTAMVANTIYLHPFKLDRSVTVGEIGARVTGAAAGSSVQFAIYGTTNGEPVGAPLATTVSLSGATAQPISDDVADVDVTGGAVYWFGSNSDSAITLQNINTASTYYVSIVGAPTLAQATSSGTASFYQRQLAQTFGTWPTLEAGATSVITGSNRGGMPFLRIAALL
jgi:hypothetical protein